MTTENVSLYDRLPKVTWEQHEDGWGWDYKTPEGEWGWRSSALGGVKWDTEANREAWIAYDALMRCSSFYMFTHGYPPVSARREILEFEERFQKIGRYIVGAGSDEECREFTLGLQTWVNDHPRFFESYIRQKEIEREPDSFEILSMYESKK